MFRILVQTAAANGILQGEPIDEGKTSASGATQEGSFLLLRQRRHQQHRVIDSNCGCGHQRPKRLVCLTQLFSANEIGQPSARIRQWLGWKCAKHPAKPGQHRGLVPKLRRAPKEAHQIGRHSPVTLESRAIVTGAIRLMQRSDTEGGQGGPVPNSRGARLQAHHSMRQVKASEVTAISIIGGFQGRASS